MLCYMFACSAWAEDEYTTAAINETAGNKKQQGETKYARMSSTEEANR